MGLFGCKKKPECEHEYEVIHNADFYDQYQPRYHTIWDCFTETKIRFSDEFLKILKEKGISEEKVLNLIRENLEPVYKEELKKELEKRKAIGHVIIQRCKKCGKIYKDVTSYNDIRTKSVVESLIG